MQTLQRVLILAARLACLPSPTAALLEGWSAWRNWYNVDMPRHHRPVLAITVIGYTLGLLAWFVLWLLVGDRLWWLALLNTAALALFLPLPLLAVVVLMRHRWRLLMVLSLPVWLFAYLYGLRFLPHTRPTISAAAPRLTAMTFNILYRNHDTQAVTTAIAAVQPDLLGLQEVTPAHARWFAETFAADYPYMVFRVDEPEAGVALLSRYPIMQVTRFALPPRNLALHAVVDVAGTPLHVLVVHLSPNRALRTLSPDIAPVAREYYQLKATEVQLVLAELREVQGPHLVLCDCNLTETSAAYAQLAAVVQDSFQEAGWGLGLTSQGPGLPLRVQRIDYIWHSPDLVIETAYVGPAAGSDHRSVVAHLRLSAKR